ncbi:hypothetical protein CJO91_13045 [Ralstonia solanacearum]|nr:hypothetical protein CJO91_13045 [Ralstonia solanacearum]
MQETETITSRNPPIGASLLVGQFVTIELDLDNGLDVGFDRDEALPVDVSAGAHGGQLWPRRFEDDAIRNAQQPLLRPAFQIALEKAVADCSAKREATCPVGLVAAH